MSRYFHDFEINNKYSNLDYQINYDHWFLIVSACSLSLLFFPISNSPNVHIITTTAPSHCWGVK